jgi:hypothetical protein
MTNHQLLGRIGEAMAGIRKEIMARGITVKVSTQKVIVALEAKLTSVKNDYANQEEYEAKFQQEFAAWQKSITDYAIKHIDKAVNFRTNIRQWQNTVNIDYDVPYSDSDLPAMPERKFESIREFQYKEIVDDITNALSILRMTDETTVNASTMKQIAKYL